MIFPYECPKCHKTFWAIKYNSETRTNRIECANCGFAQTLEEIFGGRKKNESPKNKLPDGTNSSKVPTN